ncbi:MAG: transketolase [Rhodospirillaceae bacterium TMED167]|nr:transketolase [Rhodospirillaceae bacterium]OUW30032.1 MAG: transketolase [Rhodospirillaceae bacterium TMED167]
MRRTCLDMVYELARKNERVVFIGSDLGPGVLDDMRTEMPHRFFMEGVSEANIIGMAAGLALDGYIPYVNTIATFLTRRCFEQISMDLCLHNLPVRLIANGGGLVYAPLGPTHIAIDDIGLMRTQPNMTVVSPSDADEMRHLMPETLDWNGPMYIRLGKGGDPVISHGNPAFKIGKGIILRPPTKITLAASGIMSGKALEAANILNERGTSCGVVHFPTIKPLDVELVRDLAEMSDVIVTLDEHLLNNGLGTAILETLNDAGSAPLPTIRRLGIQDQFTRHYGSQDTLLEEFGLQPHQIAEEVERTAREAQAINGGIQ